MKKLKENKNEFVFCCKECGGVNIEQKAWVDVNTDKVLDSASEGDIEDNWCRDCENHTYIIFKKDWKNERDKAKR